MAENILELGVRDFLLADAGVMALVATAPDFAGVYPAPAPQNAPMPFITFQRVSTPRVYDLDGSSGLEYPLIQIDCWADAPEQGGAYKQTKQLAKAVRLALNDYHGDLAGALDCTVSLTQELDLFEAQDRTRRVSLAFRIWHDET